MKKTLLIGMVLPAISLAWAMPSGKVSEVPALIPQPQELKVHTGKQGFRMVEGIRVVSPEAGGVAYGEALEILETAGVPLVKGQGASELEIRFVNHANPGYYGLTVTRDMVTIDIADTQGLHYAAQTLAQAMVTDENGMRAFPGLTIKDYPLYQHRGIMVDSGRHALPVDEIKRIIRVMARYKLNILHWHLTDDQGWRIEIKKYPKLTEVGGTRSESTVQNAHSKRDGVPYTAWYSQEEIKDVVAYAHKHGITVIPEIEIPGHAAAAICAYPELGNTDIADYNPQVESGYGVFPYVFAPKPEFFEFIDGVLDEVCALFPNAPYIHMGGDEAPRDQWKASAYAQAFMKEKGFRSEAQIQSYIMQRAEEILAKHKRRLVGWDEIQEGGLTKTAIVMVWRGANHGKTAIAQGNDIIMCPADYFYFDHGQGLEPDTIEYKVNIRSEKDWKLVYTAPVLPPNMTAEQERQVLGVQANHWSEYIPNAMKWQYHAFPRCLALSEVGWLSQDRRTDVESFAKRIEAHYAYLDSEGINFRQEDGSARKGMTQDKQSPRQ